MWRVVLVVYACTGCDAVLRFEHVTPPPPTFASYSYRKAITITQPTASTLHDFPVSVFAADADIDAHAQSDGSDLVFGTDTDALECDVVAHTGGGIEAWVRVPELPSGQTTIYVYYGGATRTRNPADTWADPFHVVWHESLADISEADSSHHEVNLAASMVTPMSVPGIVGRGRQFTGTMGQQMCAADNGQLSFDVGAMSYSMWLFVEPGTSTALSEPLHKGGSSMGSPGFDFEFTTEWEAGISDPTMTASAIVAPAPRTGAWVQVAGVVDRMNNKLLAYVDGINTDEQDITGLGTLTGTDQLCLGGDQDNTNTFTGTSDEVRVYAGTISPDWLRFEYDNLADRDNVIAIGPEQQLR